MKKNILIGISSSVAAFKSYELISRLVRDEYNVKVIVTKNALKLVSPALLETLSKNEVFSKLWQKDMREIKHIELARWADLILICPATFNIIGKLANGIADDMLTSTIVASKAPIYIAPAMNNFMYENPILKKNIERLKAYNYNFIEPEEGFLACNVFGKGRLSKIENILAALKEEDATYLKNVKILITAGSTQEFLDPIRYLSNNSSGKMAYELAKLAQKWGAHVRVIAGMTKVERWQNFNTINVKTALEMREEVLKSYEEQDIVIAAAAVSDYRAKKIAGEKIKKTSDELSLELVKNPDILRELGEKKVGQILVGFCAESENLIERAKEKLTNKNLDLIIANDVKYFNSNKNKAYIIDRTETKETSEMGKSELAKIILKTIKSKFLN